MSALVKKSLQFILVLFFISSIYGELRVTCVKSFAFEDQVYGLTWSPDGKYLAAGFNDGILSIWNAETYDSLRTLRCYYEPLISILSWSPDGTKLAIGCSRTRVEILSVKDLKLLQRLFVVGPQYLNDLSWSPDGSKLAAAFCDHMLCMWDTKTYKLLQELKAGRTVCWSHDGKKLICGHGDGAISTLDALTYEDLKTIRWCGYNFHPESISLSPDGDKLVAGYSKKDGRFYILHADSYKLLAKIKGNKSWFNRFSWSPSGDVLASASKDKTVRIWRLFGPCISKPYEKIKAIKHFSDVTITFKSGI